MGVRAFMTLQILGIIAAWSSQALEDGKITIKEAVDLASRLAVVLDVPVDIDMSTLFPGETREGDVELVPEGEETLPLSAKKPEE